MWHRMRNVRSGIVKWLLRRGILTACYMVALSSCRGCKNEELASSQISLGELVFQVIDNNLDNPQKRAVVYQDREPLITSVDYVAGSSLPKPDAGARNTTVLAVQQQTDAYYLGMTQIVAGATSPLTDDETITAGALPQSPQLQPQQMPAARNNSAAAVTHDDHVAAMLSQQRIERRIEQLIRLVNERRADRMFTSASRILEAVHRKALTPLSQRFAFLDDALVHMTVEQLHEAVKTAIGAIQQMRQAQHWSESVESLSQTIEQMLPESSGDTEDDIWNLARQTLHFVRKQQVKPAINQLFANGQQAASLVTLEDLDLLEQLELELQVLQAFVAKLSPKQWQDLLAIASHFMQHHGGFQSDGKNEKQLFMKLRATPQYRKLLQHLPQWLPRMLQAAGSDPKRQQLLWHRCMRLVAMATHNMAPGEPEATPTAQTQTQQQVNRLLKRQVKQATQLLDLLPHAVDTVQDAAKILAWLTDAEFDLLLQIIDWAVQSDTFSGSDNDPLQALQLLVAVRSLPAYQDVLQLLPKLIQHLSSLPNGKAALVVQRLLQAAMSFAENSSDQPNADKDIWQTAKEAQQVLTLLLRLDSDHYSFILQCVADLTPKQWNALLQTLIIQRHKADVGQNKIALDQVPTLLNHLLTLRPLWNIVKEPLLDFVYCQHNSCPDKSQQRWETLKKAVAWLWPVAMSEGSHRQAERQALFGLMSLSPDAKLLQQLYAGDTAAQNRLRRSLQQAANSIDVSQFTLQDIGHLFRVVVNTLKHSEGPAPSLTDLDEQLAEMDGYLLTEENWADLIQRDPQFSSLQQRLLQLVRNRISPSMETRAEILVEILEKGRVENSLDQLISDRIVGINTDRLRNHIRQQMQQRMGRMNPILFSLDSRQKEAQKAVFRKFIREGVLHHVYLVLWNHMISQARGRQLDDAFFAMLQQRCVDIYGWLWPSYESTPQQVKLAAVTLTDTAKMPQGFTLPTQSPLLALLDQQDVQLLLQLGCVVLEDIQQDETSLVRVGLELYQEFAENSVHAYRYDLDVWQEVMQQQDASALGETLLVVMMDDEQMPIATWSRIAIKALAIDKESSGIVKAAVISLSDIMGSDAFVQVWELVRKLFPLQQPQQGFSQEAPDMLMPDDKRPVSDSMQLQSAFVHE
ncbi:MAG: hypothetical protein AAF310_00860 [Myxococcota bacterium]